MSRAQIACLWNPESLRAQSFARAAASQGVTLRQISWAAFLSGTALSQLDASTVLRIDTPGKCWPVEQALLARGHQLVAAEPFASVQAASLTEDPGRIFASRQHYLGLCSALEQARLQWPQIRWLQHPEEIQVMSDKTACQALLDRSGVRVPPALGVCRGFDDLMARMREAKAQRVFLKLCHSSSASGSVALEMSGSRIQAFSTARMETSDGSIVLRNRRSVIRYTDLREIRSLVDAVCLHRAHAERWIPKAGWQGKRFDVRVLVIAGRACQVVARLADGPFTNLQIGATRGSREELQAWIGPDAFAALCTQAEQAAACFPRCLHAGVDVMLHARSGEPYVLEVNAFGDFLPGALWAGKDSHEHQLLHVSTTGT